MLKKAYNAGYEDAKLNHVNDADEYAAEVEYNLDDYLENTAIAECDRVWGFDSGMEDAFIMGVKWALRNA
jgi:hypothetical protein